MSISRREVRCILEAEGSKGSPLRFKIEKMGMSQGAGLMFKKRRDMDNAQQSQKDPRLVISLTVAPQHSFQTVVTRNAQTAFFDLSFPLGTNTEAM